MQRKKDVGIISLIILCLFLGCYAIYTKIRAEREIDELDELNEELSLKLLKAERNTTNIR